MRLITSLLLASSLCAIRPGLAAADQCAPARVMVVLDKSSSMVDTIAGQTKWSIATSGLDQVLAAYDSNAEFGLITFPNPSQCAPGAVNVEPAIGNRAAITAALTAPPPSAGNWTPMAQTLEVAAEVPSLSTASATRHVILITDGWQWCDPYDPATRYDGVPAVQALADQGVTTWIVGFGDEVDTAALNQMAVAAGTARPNCDATNSDPAAPNNCYFQVDDAQQLVSALTAIAGSISDEQCDGIDNDCDGETDEELSRSCTTVCGSQGIETCAAGGWADCAPVNPSPEQCNGVDDNCDGNVDEDDGLLCGEGDACVDGECQPLNPADGSMAAGCCSTSDGSPVGSLAPFALIGLALIGRRRRR